VLACAKLDSKEGEDAVGRMAEDTSRVHTAMLARCRTVAGVAGTQDGRARESYAHEMRGGTPGLHARHMARGCAGCAPRVHLAVPEACGTCHGWRRRGPRGAANVCVECGGGCPTRDDGDASAARALVHLATRENEHVRPRRLTAAENDAARALVHTGRARARRQPWGGFANLPAAAVERLMREGDHTDADARASDLPSREPSATVRHIHGMECDGVAGAVHARQAAADTVNAMQRLTASVGGRASALMEQLACAHTYLRRTPAASRSLGREEEWRAFQRIVAADLCNVDWCVSGGAADTREEACARREFAKAMTAMAVDVGLACKDARCAWQRKAAAEVEWRRQSEAWRERLRVIMRAWRERCDVTRVQPGGHGALAAKMAQGPFAPHGCGATRLWQLGWHVKALIEWMRLVRGTRGHVQRASDAPRPEHGHAMVDPRTSELRRARPAHFTVRNCEECDTPNDADGTSRARTCRTDYTLSMRAHARSLLRAHLLSAGETRLVHAQRARGDG
jgi:hypothetical protein